MDRRTIVLTGASDGIGAAAARTLAAHGHRLLLVGRSPEKTRAVAEEVGAEHFVADFARLEEVRTLAAALRERLDGGLDVLANNAGGIFGAREMTEDGNEYTLQVNHLAPFLLTHLLMDPLTAGGGGAVVSTSSIAARYFGRLRMEDLDNARRYSSRKAYGDAKLANILFTRGLHERFHERGLGAMAFHPGVVATNFASASNSVLRWAYHTPLKRLLTITAEEGGSNLTWAVEGTPGEDWDSGVFYDQRVPARSLNPQVLDDVLVDRFWEASAERVGLTTGPGARS
ncbi:SDR family NAD(P)-dependent oxidoreductase [Rothia sp. AR01]|uniref:SDR family NAD(P)-dependent oxidoreductase n=1 Tax=Rothia santali TaxID=2949643 RepID=A0A9X2KJV8_9MICC|nr:SDR family NAD(P)-dependent oxidoreductase [Rothia santali]MCP3427269.1 SDR family NAD(P)-dependent oxidoreductase [Rothia santali]